MYAILKGTVAACWLKGQGHSILIYYLTLYTFLNMSSKLRFDTIQHSVIGPVSKNNDCYIVIL